uniref:Tubby C-terminal domain-containing protein n=1 Tax=Cyclophora tenuis TaxID=216820 RepID=A0A7S1D0H7_CYCTE|mmetsp:Transcript_17355/g.29433  ORF Transcript_17355/g.29433 Transcript_17355/m.29433 type:complete len:182 (+) Transcript_17355:285-830(+)
MKHFFINENIFDAGGDFSITDEFDQIRFRVDAKNNGRSLIRDKMILRDAHGKRLAQLRQVSLFPVSRYQIIQSDRSKGGRHVTARLCAYANLTKHYHFTIRWPTDPDEEPCTVHGDVMGWDFRITQNGHTIASVSHKLSAHNDLYGIRINETDDNEVVKIIGACIIICRIVRDQQIRRTLF